MCLLFMVYFYYGIIEGDSILMERYEEIERTIIKNYRKKIWTKFIKGIQEFDIIGSVRNMTK